MNSNISCSFGEIIDKVTILRIKKEKSLLPASRENIMKELNAIENNNPFCIIKDELFDELQSINLALWFNEDLIRVKSSKNEFDGVYIKCAENIHKINDERYRVKRRINDKYNSNIIEEKIFTNNIQLVITELSSVSEHNLGNITCDMKVLENAKERYNNCDFVTSFSMISPLMEKYKDIHDINRFIMDLRISFDILTNHFDVDSELVERNIKALEMIDKEIENINISDQFKEFWKSCFDMHCLRNNKYLKSRHSFLYNRVYGPNIRPEDMSFFDVSDKNKTLLVYNGGGIGDMIMHFRFVRSICHKYCENNLVVIVEDKMIWMMKASHSDVNNLTLIPSSNKNKLPDYDYHCSIHMLSKYLQMEYEEIPYTPYLKNIELKTLTNKPNIRKRDTHKIVVFNWKGSDKFSQEIFNRRMELIKAVPLFKLPNVSWIVVTQDISREEALILEENNVAVMNKDFDRGEDAFADTVSLFSNVDFVVSTDTSLLHLAGTMDVPTIALLTRGCEWRWSRQDQTTKWYPNMKLIKQRIQGCWTSVVDELIHFLS